MGYKRKRTHVLEFDDNQFDGLEVVADSASMDEYFTIRDLLDRPTSTAAGARDDLREIFDLLVPKLVSWNLEAEDGSPVPLDRETFGSQDREFTGAIVQAWLQAVQGVRRPLPTPSPSGEQSVAASIPTETLSASQVS